MTHKQITLNPISIPGAAQAIRDNGKDSYGLHYMGVFTPLLLLLIILHVPATLIWLEIIPFKYRFHALFLVMAGFVYYCFVRRYSLRELGFRTDNINGSLGWNFLFCVAGAIGLYMTYKAGILRPKSQNPFPGLYVFYIFFLGPVQEVVFRGILFAEIKRTQFLHNRSFLWVSSLSFCFLHIIYRHPPLLMIALISGLAWGLIFTKWPNIWGIVFSHSLLGALALFLGVI